MRIILVLIINLIIGCSSPDKSSNAEDNLKLHLRYQIKSALAVSNSLNNDLPEKVIIITVSYAAIECGCPQWFETKFKDVKFLEGVERFYLEPITKDIVNANDLWDGEHLPLTVKITGRFSKEKEVPVTYNIKGIPEKAKIFWYDKITVESPSYKR